MDLHRAARVVISEGVFRARPTRVGGDAEGGEAGFRSAAGDEPERPRRDAGRNIALKRLDIRCLQTFGAALCFVAHFLVLGERLETFAANFGEVCEKIVAATIRGDEAEALAVVEPLYDAGVHDRP